MDNTSKTNSKENLSLVQDIHLKEKIGYGLGDFASNLIWSSIGMFLMFYYTEVAIISTATVGTIMLFSRLLDGVTDLGMGVLVDKTKSKHGKARPWLLWLPIPFMITAVLLFSVPDVGTTGKIIYAIITYNLATLLYTGINIPYGALNSLLTQDQYQRSVLNLFRMSFAIVGALIVSMITLPMVNAFGGGQGGWQITFLIIGGMSAVIFLITFRTTKERVKQASPQKAQNSIPIAVGIKALIKNKYWIIVLLFFIVTNVANGLNQGSTVYFAQYILGNSELVGLISFTTMIPLFIGMLVVSPLIKKLGKRNSMMLGIIISLLGAFFILIDPSNLVIVLVSRVIISIGNVPVTGTMFALLADTIEYGEWKSGVRTEGLVYSAGSLGAKVGTGLGTALIGWVLAMGGYIGGNATQADSAMISINALFIYIPILLALLKFIILYFYKLDKLYPQIIQDLQARNQN